MKERLGCNTWSSLQPQKLCNFRLSDMSVFINQNSSDSIFPKGNSRSHWKNLSIKCSNKTIDERTTWIPYLEFIAATRMTKHTCRKESQCHVVLGKFGLKPIQTQFEPNRNRVSGFRFGKFLPKPNSLVSSFSLLKFLKWFQIRFKPQTVCTYNFFL